MGREGSVAVTGSDGCVDSGIERGFVFCNVVEIIGSKCVSSTVESGCDKEQGRERGSEIGGEIELSKGHNILALEVAIKIAVDEVVLMEVDVEVAVELKMVLEVDVEIELVAVEGILVEVVVVMIMMMWV